VNDYTAVALAYLKLAFDDRSAVFSYSSSVDEDGQLVNDFRMPESLRYTINTYLGLSEAERHSGPIEWLGGVKQRVHDFLELHERALGSLADHGLLLLLLASVDPAHPAVDRCFDQITSSLDRGDALRHLNMQDLAWTLWGLAAWAADPRAPVPAHRIFELMRTRFVHPVSGLPRHSVASYRAHTTSFGSVVYFLRAIHEYGEAFDSDVARGMFAHGIERVLAIQGADAGWPWMIDVRTGVPFDRYPIFTVHQDSMAMLFLFPADRRGLSGAREAIERSIEWNLGRNELGLRMIQTEPYPWIFRSIERDERAGRIRRYLRGLGRAPAEHPPRSDRVRVNSECRSYHLGWVLYAWSDEARLPLLNMTHGTHELA